MAATAVVVFARFLAGAIALEVTNPNNPDRGRVLANPADVESLASAGSSSRSSPRRSVPARFDGTAAYDAVAADDGVRERPGNNNGDGPAKRLPRGPIDNSAATRSTSRTSPPSASFRS
jgi:hypothetical protein